MRKPWIPLLIFAWCVCVLSQGISDTGSVFKGDEHFYYESARRMLRSGDIVTPRYLGEERFQKPILFYWLVMLSFRLCGVAWWSARLPSVVLGGITAVLVYLIARKLFGVRQGIVAGFVLPSIPLFYRYARLALPETTLTLFVTAALFFFVTALAEQRYFFVYALNFFTVCALAFLVKGPVGIILPLLIAAAVCLYARRRVFFTWGAVGAGLLIFAAITIPWFYLIYARYGQTYASYVWSREIIQRLGYGRATPFAVECIKGIGYYAAVVMTRLAPWSFFLPAACVMAATTRNRRNKEMPLATYLMLACLWCGIVFFFFSCVPEKRMHYMLPLTPAVAILASLVIVNGAEGVWRIRREMIALPRAITAGVACGGLVLIALWFFVSGQGFWDFTRGTACAVTAVCLWLYMRSPRRRWYPVFLAAALTMLYVICAVYAPAGIMGNKMEKAARAIQAHRHNGDRVVVGSHGFIPEEVQAYFDTPVTVAKIRYEKSGAPDSGSVARITEILTSPQRVFCIIKKDDFYGAIPAALRSELRIIERYYVWKRRIRFGEKAGYPEPSFREIFQNELFVITNR